MGDDDTGAKTSNLAGRDIEEAERSAKRSGFWFGRSRGVGDDQKVESIPKATSGLEKRFHTKIAVAPHPRA